MSAVWAVVLAGGQSRRFGSDKLEARLDSRRLLEHALRDLPDDTRLVLVGPVREELAANQPITYVREDPPGGGPAAAMVTGLITALRSDAASPDDLILVLPGDTPAAGGAAALLLAALRDCPEALALVGVDAEGREQPLQLALRHAAADRLVAVAGGDRGHGASARVLVDTLGACLGRVTLPEDLRTDIDTPADLDRWRRRH